MKGLFSEIVLGFVILGVPVGLFVAGVYFGNHRAAMACADRGEFIYGDKRGDHVVTCKVGDDLAKRRAAWWIFIDD